MPSTDPFSASVLNKIKGRTQAVRWSAYLKEVRAFAAYCCDIDSDGIMGVAKQPVPIVNISPNPVCLGESIDWDLTNSYAPGSTVSQWDIDFGDGDTDTGADINTASGSHTYAAIGSYTITVVIEEGLGKTQTITREINVVDCTLPPIEWLYVATDGDGVYYRELPDGAWTARNNNLTGNALFVRSLVMRPGNEFKNPNAHEIWIATKGGIFKSENGGNTWQPLAMGDPSNDEFEDIPAVTEDELDWVHIVFDPLDKNTIYIEARKI